MSESPTEPVGDEDRRRRTALWWWLLLLVLLLLLLFSFCRDDSPGQPDSAAATPAPTIAAPTTVRATTAGTAGSTAAPPQQPDLGDGLEGTWDIEVTVTETSGVCAGEENEPAYVHTVTITRTGDTTFEVTGMGNPGEAWAGSLAGDQLVFQGERDEDGGVTRALFTMTAHGDGTLTGTEKWSWESTSDGSCPDGVSVAEAVFVGP